jgi:hypothetical protein
LNEYLSLLGKFFVVEKSFFTLERWGIQLEELFRDQFSWDEFF